MLMLAPQANTSGMVHFMDIFPAVLKQWLLTVRNEEIPLQKCFQNGEPCLVAEYLKFRDVTSLCHMFHAFGLLYEDVSEVVWNDTDFKRLRVIAALIAGIDNDIVSFHKDDNIDLIKLLMLSGKAEADALMEAIAIHHEYLSEYSKLKELLEVRYPSSAGLAFFLEKVLPGSMHGALLWQVESKRFIDSCMDGKFHVDPDIVQDLFPCWTAPCYNEVLAAEISHDSEVWAGQCGLLSVCPVRKWRKMNLGSGAVRAHFWHDPDDQDRRRISLCSRFLGWACITDDLLEDPARTESICEVALSCMQEDCVLPAQR